MFVTAQPIDAPVVLLETTHNDRAGKTCVTRMLVFREGLLATPVLAMIAKLLEHL